MTLKKACQLGWLRSALLSISLSFLAFTTQASVYPGQTIQIYTQFRSVASKPIWLLVLRDEQTGQVLPYLYDVRNNDNFWMALALSHSYRIKASTLTFESQNVIHNFCDLEDGILERESMSITLSGDLKPNSDTLRCHTLKYKDFPIPITEHS